jgi:hypothetical protein
VLFRKVILHEDTDSAKEVNEHICRRLCDAEDQLPQLVRHFELRLASQEARCASAQVLTGVLNCIKELRDFSSVQSAQC